MRGTWADIQRNEDLYIYMHERLTHEAMNKYILLYYFAPIHLNRIWQRKKTTINTTRVGLYPFSPPWIWKRSKTREFWWQSCFIKRLFYSLVQFSERNEEWWRRYLVFALAQTTLHLNYHRKLSPWSSMASLVLFKVCQPVCFAQLMIEGDPSGLAGSHSSMAFDSVVAIVSLLDNLGHFVWNLKTGASISPSVYMDNWILLS